MLFSLEWCLETHIKNPVLLLAAYSNEVHSFASLQNLVRQIVCQESRYHNVVQLVLFSPKLIIANIRVSLYEELLKWVINLACQHPGFDHREDRCGDFF